MADYFALMLISVAVAFGGDKLTLGSEYRNKHRRLIICSLIIFIQAARLCWKNCADRRIL